MHGPHQARQDRAIADTSVEHTHRRRPWANVIEFLRHAVRDDPLLAAGIDEEQIFLPVVIETKGAFSIDVLSHCGFSRLALRNGVCARTGCDNH